MSRCPWKNITTTVKTHLPNDITAHTRLQWADLGYVVNRNATGKELYTNQHCQHKSIYYLNSEVHTASTKELIRYYLTEEQEKHCRALKAANERNYLYELQQTKEKLTATKTRMTAMIEAAHDAMNTYISMLSDITEPSGTIVIDTETTGLNDSENEILQLSIINSDGKTLFNEYFKPLYSESWQAAESINGISPEMVKDCKHITDYLPEIIKIIMSAETIIGYNIGFDMGFLAAVGIKAHDKACFIDVMADFAAVYGEWNEYHQSYKWQKLTTAAAYYNYDWGTDAAHDSLSDCKATLYVYNMMQNSP